MAKKRVTMENKRIRDEIRMEKKKNLKAANKFLNLTTKIKEFGEKKPRGRPKRAVDAGLI